MERPPSAAVEAASSSSFADAGRQLRYEKRRRQTGAPASRHTKVVRGRERAGRSRRATTPPPETSSATTTTTRAEVHVVPSVSVERRFHSPSSSSDASSSTSSSFRRNGPMRAPRPRSRSQGPIPGGRRTIGGSGHHRHSLSSFHFPKDPGKEANDGDDEEEEEDEDEGIIVAHIPGSASAVSSRSSASSSSRSSFASPSRTSSTDPDSGIATAGRNSEEGTISNRGSGGASGGKGKTLAADAVSVAPAGQRQLPTVPRVNEFSKEIVALLIIDGCKECEANLGIGADDYRGIGAKERYPLHVFSHGEKVRDPPENTAKLLEGAFFPKRAGHSGSSARVEKVPRRSRK